MEALDSQIRLAAFQFLKEQSVLHGELLPREVLAQGFVFEDKRVPLIGPQGIFKPAILSGIPLSITTVPVVEGQRPPYDDEMGENGFIRYRYRGQNPQHRDNVGMRLAMKESVPIIYFFGVVPGQYMPVWPVYIVGDDPVRLTFTLEIGVEQNVMVDPLNKSESVIKDLDYARSYRTASFLYRLHQTSFRRRVLDAYRKSCAVCKLGHDELLEAAHILPDNHPKGEPWVSNGLALCKLHHAAFDKYILGIRPDLVIEIRKDILEEADGPLLLHGLQEWHRQHLQVVPSRKQLRPNREFLEERYALFREAC